LAERLDACRTHFEKSVEWKGPKVGIFEMRRHYANYFKGLPNFKEYRMKLVGSESPDEIREIMVNIASEYSGLELN
jgi:tRNA-dihydrouridine synthase